MTQKQPALKFLQALWQDVSDPNFIWEVAALAICLGAAWLIARWWHGRHEEGSGRLAEAGLRLVFPLTALVLAGIGKVALQSFMQVNLFNLAKFEISIPIHSQV